MGRRAVQAMLALGLAAAGLSACATAPRSVSVNHQRIVPLAKADVWVRLHAFFQDEGIAVESENLLSGVIDAGRSADRRGTLTGLADCGPRLLHRMRRQDLKLTVMVRPTGDGTRVTVNAAFAEVLASRRAGAFSVACPSTGVLEAAVLSVASGQPMEAAVIPH